jgi:hypothetical protein
MTHDETPQRPDSPSPDARDPGPRPVRTGTVVWGFILIGIAALFFAGTQIDLGGLDPAVVAVWVVLGIGVLAVIGGLIGMLVRRRD